MRRPRRAAVALAVVAGVSACESSVDRQRAAICRRALPALLASAGGLKVLRIADGPEGSIRIDYAVTDASAQAGRQRWVSCRFGPGAELAGLTTERGAIGGASLYLLKRYYLDTPEAAAADPAAAGR